LDGHVLLQQVVEKCQSELEQAQVATMPPVDHALPSFFDGRYSKGDDPVVCKKHSHQQTIDAFWTRHVAFLQIEPASLLVGKACLDQESLSVETACFIGTLHVRHQMDGLVTALSPPSQPRYGSVAPMGKESLGHNEHTTGLEMRKGLFVREPVVFPTESVGFGGAQNVMPTAMVYDTLQIDTVKFTVAEQDDVRPFGNHFSNIPNQLDVPLFAEVALFLFLNQPGYGQHPPLVDDCDHECHASASDDGPVDQHDKRLTGQCLQDLPGEGEEEDFTSHVFVLYPAIETLHLAFRFGAAPYVTSLGRRGFSSDLWQLNASGSDDSANESSEGIQMSRLISIVFGPRELLE